MPRGYKDWTVPIAWIEQLIGVKLVADWGAIQAEDVDAVGGALAATGTWTQLITYTVPAGKTLLIYDWSAAIENGDGQIIGNLQYISPTVHLSYSGGQRGFQASFLKPKRVTEGKTVVVLGRQDTGSDKLLEGTFGGTLI